jgi:penicillin amidase
MAFHRRIHATRLLLWLLASGLLVALCVPLAGWMILRASLPALTGSRMLPGLGADVTVDRDADGVPTVHAGSPEDMLRALGYLHAQERFFQMDLLRRQSAGELSGLFGPDALGLDVAVRMHRFRLVAGETLKNFGALELRQLDAYVAGVNAGLAALPARPWEYYLLHQAPRPWTREDCVLVVESMTMALQDSTGLEQRTRLAIEDCYGPAVLAFLRPAVTEATAALDGSSAPAPPIPPAAAWIPHSNIPRVALPPHSANAAPPGSPASLLAAWLQPPSPDRVPGSNNFALAGSRVQGGGALVADDMHLGLSVPNTWYRARLELPGHAFTGVTLPGVPGPIAGSNGDVAWGFTDAYIGASDVVIVETDPADPTRYRVPDGDGWEKFETAKERIAIAGAQTVEVNIVSTRWGPLLTPPGAPGRALALHWIAYDPQAVNFELANMLYAHSVDDAIAVARRTGIPAENMIVGDRAGHIAWTIIGRVPNRIGFDGMLPHSWAGGSCDWDGFLSPGDLPIVRDPPDGQLWTANNRVIGGGALDLIGNGGYDYPTRAAQIRDRLTALADRPATSADLLAIQLDDESLYLKPWRDLLLTVLTDDATRKDPRLGELRRLVEAWDGHASVNEAGHRLVKTFRSTVADMILNPIYAPIRKRLPEAHFGLDCEQPLWSILNARPAHLLPRGYPAWDDLLLRAARFTSKLGERHPGGKALRDCTWGAANVLSMRHPLSGLFPLWLGKHLDMPAQPLPGDSELPRVQGRDFGASERFVVSPGREAEGIYEQPGGESGHPLSPFYSAGHENWVKGNPSPLLPGASKTRLVLRAAR